MGVLGGKVSPAVASVKVIEKVAVTARMSLMVTVHVVGVPLQAPPQLLKRLRVPGAAVRVTTVPPAKFAEQLEEQLRPAGLLVTAPAAEPRTVRLSATGSPGVVTVASLE